jgi:hypothetical protein
MSIAALVEKLQSKTLVFTVTSGRSGTKLLCQLLQQCTTIHAEHEPAPRLNFVMRSIALAPSAARGWLTTEKLPHIVQTMQGDAYAETSHLTCKGFIEPLLSLGLRPKFIILKRPAREVAASLYKMNCIPERTENGRLVLLGPTDRDVLGLRDWQIRCDYQLCYWYALEIERRQVLYKTEFDRLGICYFETDMVGLSNWSNFSALVETIRHGEPLSRERFQKILSIDQNPRVLATGMVGDRTLPPDLEGLESELKAAISHDAIRGAD